MNYNEAHEYLANFVNYEKIVPQNREVFNLERVRRFLTRLDSPQLQYPSIVLAGTKGKGSTAFLIASALQSASYRVGLYTQPHIHDFRERLQINGQLITETDFAKLVTEIRPLVELSLQEDSAEWGALTTYEVVTALVLLYFARQQVDFAVLEIGLGGELDAVNVVNPLVSVITSISYDHMAILGSTLPEIARAKAGIIKPATPLVTVPQNPAVLKVLQEVCQKQSAPLTLVEPAKLVAPEQPLSPTNRYKTSQKIGLNFGPKKIELDLGLLGEHQRLNAALAAEALWQQQQQGGLTVNAEAIQVGFSRQNWPGRLQLVAAQAGQSLVVADAAHNAESAARLREALVENFYYEKLWYVVGIYQDKDIAGFLRELAASPKLGGIIFTRSQSPRAADPALLLEQARQYFAPSVRLEAAPTVPLARQLSQQQTTQLDLICFTGSFSVVAELNS